MSALRVRGHGGEIPILVISILQGKARV